VSSSEPSNRRMDFDRTPSTVLSTVLCRVSIGGFECCERQVVARRTNPRHSHDYHCIGFLISGRGTAELGTQRWTIQPGCLNVIPGGVQHVEWCGTRQVRWCGIEIPALRDEFAAEARRVFDRPFQVSGGPAAAIVVRMYREIRLADDASALSLQGLGLELLATLARVFRPSAGEGRGGWIARAEDYLRANFQETLTLDEVAAEVGVHPTHLARVFRRQFGSSMGEFLRGLRIEHAVRLLAQGHMQLSEISQCSGFSDQAHFTRVFKRHLGMTPGAYRLRLCGR
jgi:AraC family transcriptional regulator